MCDACDAKNDDINFSCQKCGQVRGLQPATATTETAVPDSGSPFPEAPSLPTTPAKKSPLRFWWVAVLIIGIIAAISGDSSIPRDDSGAIIDSGTMTVHDLRVGDCFDFDGEGTEDEIQLVETVTGKNCALAHDYEVFLLHEITETSYPSEFRLDRLFEDVCLSEFEAYVGSQWEVSEVWADMMWPSEEGWNDDNDRTLTCFLFELEGPTFGSFRDSQR